MRPIVSVFVVLAGFGSGISPAVAEDRAALQPTSNWHVSLEDGICSASRKYGDTTLTFEHYGLPNGFMIMVAGDAVNRSKARYGTKAAREVNVRFGPSYEAYDRTVFRGRIKDVGNALIIAHGGLVDWDDHDDDDDTPKIIPAADPEPVEWLEIEQNRYDYLRFAVPGFGSAYAVLELCVDQLVESWGLDPAEQRALTQTPRIPKNAGWLYNIHFPYRELNEGIEGRVWLRFMVDAEGRATSCKALRGTHTDRFQKHCDQLVKIARFEPAIAADGKPVPSYSVASVSYELL